MIAMLSQTEINYLAAHREQALERIHALLSAKPMPREAMMHNVGAAQAIARRALDENEVLGYGRLVGFKEYNT